MSRCITHRDIFALLGLELDLSPAELRTALFSDPAGVDRLADAAEGSPLAALNLVLSEPVGGADGGPPLVAAGVSLSPKRLRAMLARQRQAPDALLGPLVIELDDVAVGHYREMIVQQVANLIAGSRGEEGENIRIVRDRIAATPELELVEPALRGAVHDFFSAPASIAVALPVLGDKSNAALLERSINTAFVGIAVLLLYDRPAGAEALENTLKNLATAAVLQDFSVLADRGVAVADHARLSAQMAREMGASELVVQLVSEHHGTHCDPEQSAASVLSCHTLPSANAFVAKISEPGEQLFEAVKVLNYLVSVGGLDPYAVRVLGRLFLPRVKSFVIEQAARVGNTCPAGSGTGVLWPVTGDNLPSVFLCRKPGCPHETPQVSQLSRDVPFEVEGRVLATIRKGGYFTCGLLTARLKQMYAMMSEPRATGRNIVQKAEATRTS